MSFQKFKSYCVGGRHRSATKIYGDITFTGSKVLSGYCSVCNRNESMFNRDKIIQAGSLGDFFKKKHRKKGLNVSKIWQKTYEKVLEEL